MISTRLVRPEDADELAALLRLNRDFLAPWEPSRTEDYFTADAQRALIEDALEQQTQGSVLPQVITEDARIIGRITLNGIVSAPTFLSCSLGYWVSVTENGRGVATTAVTQIARIAFEERKLHRIQAETVLGNTRSQKVLERNGFTRYGVAPDYLRIAGRWQDCALYQLLNPAEV